MSSSEKIRVGILFGGQSAEHEISILSARNVLAALDRSRFEPVLIGIDKAGRWLKQDPEKLLASERDPRLVRVEPGLPVQLPSLPAGSTQSVIGGPGKMDVVFPVLHGTFGEDGALQGLLEVAGIPYVGAGVLGSAIGMDKDVMKRLLREAAVPVTSFRTIREDAFKADPKRVLAEVAAALGLPLFTKPANAGSSVGIRKVDNAAALPAAVRYAFEFDTKVVAEAAVEGREIELAVLGGSPPTVSVAGEIVVQHPDGFYSYEAKYIDDGAKLELPAKISAEQLARAQALALRAFEILECEGMARVDLFLKSDGSLVVNEINTIPGFTAISMYPKLWALSGVSPTQLITRLIELALRRGEKRTTLRRSFAPK